MISLDRSAILASVLGLLSLSVSSALASVLAEPSPRQLDEVASLIQKHYVRAVPKESLGVAARRCFNGTLDRYSAYLDSAAAAAFESEIAGRTGGIGIGLQSDSTTGVFQIVSVLVGSPAQRGGLLAGDTLTAVEGQKTRGREFFGVQGRIRGRVGSWVHLEIRRAGSLGDLRFTIRRGRIDLLSVRPLRIADSEATRYLVDERTRVAYVRIENFTRRTPLELDRALESVRRVGARALVLDLRDNSGGLVRSALGVADRFIDAGTLLIWKARGRGDEREYAHPGVVTRLPMAVLINANTISAAEILAASLQDNRRAIVVGSRSFGKGATLDLYHLKQAPGLLKLVIALAVRPSGRPLERHLPWMDPEQGSVSPDSGLAVALPDEEERRWSDATFQTTIRMRTTGAANGPPAPTDRVLQRAVEALIEGRTPEASDLRGEWNAGASLGRLFGGRPSGR